eukprot:11104782-Lingulodinium_polyedra.AAC.1
MRKDVDRLQKVLTYYKDKCPRMTDGTYPGLDVSEYAETEKASTTVKRAREGIMMHEARAIKHWLSIDGGELSYPEAKAKWDGYVNNPDHPQDEDGPTKSRRQCFVPTDTRISLEHAVEKGKQLTLKEKIKKNASEAELNRKRQFLSLNHDDFGKMEFEESDANDLESGMKKIARNLASSSAGFASDGFVVGNLDLIEEAATAAAAAAAEEQADDEQQEDDVDDTKNDEDEE